MIKLLKGDFFIHWESIKKNSIDLILTDPPYNCLEDVQKWDVALNWLKLEEIFNELLSLNGQVVMFCDMNLLMEIRNTFSKYLKYRYYMIW
ncbi:MAG: site-specific DNA-methyltransferase, partial [Candidatus Marinimicrobia bacterium]|nr:site-specific DNA-methyltransferase [Candidatus Neomarinimicrobiota bacterium]